MGFFSKLVSVFDVVGARVLASLGIGFISFAAITAIVNQLVSTADQYWGQLVGASFNLISLAGFPEGLGVVVGAIVARLSITALPKLGKIA